MLLLAHITIALSSLVYATYVFFRPSLSGLRINTGLVGLTLASGTWLVLSTHSNILSSCLSGLAYLGAVSVGLAGARYKLVSQQR